MKEQIIFNYYEFKKGFMPESIKNIHYLDDKIKLRPCYSYENRDYIFNYTKFNWFKYENTILNKEDFELFHNSHLELSVEQLQIRISKIFLETIQYQIDWFIGTYFTYYFKRNLLKDIIQEISRDKKISIIINTILSSIYLSYHKFEIANSEINQEILKRVFEQYLISLREIDYNTHTDLLIKERNRIKNIQQHDILNKYVTELENLINFSKNTYQTPSITKNSSVNIERGLSQNYSNTYIKKEIPEKLINNLTDLIIDWFTIDNKKELIKLLKLNKSTTLTFLNPFTHLSLVFTFLIIYEYYTLTQIKLFFKHNNIKHIDDEPGKTKINSDNLEKYFCKWTNNKKVFIKNKLTLNEKAAKVSVYLDLQNIFTKSSAS